MDDETTIEFTQSALVESSDIEQLQDIMDSITAKQLMDIFATGFNSFSLVVTTPDGVIVFVNNVAANGFADHTAETVCGKHLSEVTPENWANERVQYMKKAVSTMKPIPIVEMISGTRLYSTLRPIEIEHKGKLQTLIFITIEPISPVQLKWIRDNVPKEDLMISEYIGLGRLSVLTPREIEVLALMGEGLRQKEIAKKLCRSVSTVDRHRERIGEKLGIKDRAELIMLAREAGLEVGDAHRKPVEIKKHKVNVSHDE
ncbi:MAG: LuxR C-terminal-related transcriptional regulator [Phycisphaerales bacterium]|nr:LuxR C-terminal-related transcriptional regulator [Phycisphaerales bacterium]